MTTLSCVRRLTFGLLLAGGLSDSAAEAGTLYTLNQPAAIRFDRNEVLELLIEVPAGTVIDIPLHYDISYLNFRDSSGHIQRSSTGFVTPFVIVSIPKVDPSQIKKYNDTPGGLFVTATIIGDQQGIEGDFDPLQAGQPGADYLREYYANGKPRAFNFTKTLQKRFGARLNLVIDPATQTPADRSKWKAIMNELARVADRTKTTPKSLLMVDHDLGVQESIDFENKGIIPLNGAWTIAVEGTAVRHDFANVPCAEFMSENVREAYTRAGYNVLVDFNTKKKNQLIWSNTSAVDDFADALNAGGWVPWDTAEYAPITGAVCMNDSGNSPGHTFYCAGDSGRFIVDNGSPQGRDLRVTTYHTIWMMYQIGVFFLPPGITPPHWH